MRVTTFVILTVQNLKTLMLRLEILHRLWFDVLCLSGQDRLAYALVLLHELECQNLLN